MTKEEEFTSTFSSNFIEKHSMNLCALMIYILLQSNVEKDRWVENFRQFERQEKASKWFHQASRLRLRRRRNKAIHAVLPHQYVSGDAITLCLDAVKYKPRLKTYVYDVLLSVTTEAQLWTILRRTPRTSQSKKIAKIYIILAIFLLPI